MLETDQDLVDTVPHEAGSAVDKFSSASLRIRYTKTRT